MSDAEHLARLLMRCRTVLGNMAEENEGAIFRRWPINHEPLRADARNLVPLIDDALREHHKAAMARIGGFCVHGVGLPYRCVDCENDALPPSHSETP